MAQGMKIREILQKLTRNLSLKIIALLLGVFLYLYVDGIKATERIINVPMELINLPPHTMVVSPLPRNVALKVKGPKRVLKGLPTADLKYILDAGDMQIGPNVFYLTGEQIELPVGVEAIPIKPTAVTITISETIEKKLVVVPKIEGAPGKGYQVSRYSVSPPEIKVEGAKDPLSAIEKIYTMPIDINGETETIKGVTAKLDTSGMLLRNIEREEVSVDIYITPRNINKVLNNLRVTVRDGDHKFRIYPETVDVEISGPENVLEAFPLKQIEIYINIENMQPGKYRIKPVVEVPDNINVEGVKPDYIEVTILEEKS